MSCTPIPADSTPFSGSVQKPWLFQITSGPSYTSDTPAVPYYTGTRVQLSSGLYATSTPTGVVLYDPTRDKLNGENGNQELATGDWVYAQYDNDTQRWVILQGSFFKIRRIALASNMSGGSASANVVEWNGSAYVTTGSTFTVYDSMNCFPTAISGLYGFAVYEPDRAVWEAIFIPSGMCYLGVLAGTLAYGSSATANIYAGAPGAEASSFTKTVYPWMMNTGDSIASNTEVVTAVINGKFYVVNAACKNVYGS